MKVTRAISCGDRRGFSLLEIMVAVGLLGVIIVGLLVMFYQVQRAFRAGTSQVDIMEGGRATMNILTRDLQEMSATQLDFVTNFVVVPAFGWTQTTQDLPSGDLRPRVNYLQDICMMSRGINDEWIGTAYRLSNAVSGVATLYRMVLSSNTVTIPRDNSLNISNFSVYVSTNAPDDMSVTNFHRLLEGVVGFTVTPFDSAGVSFLNYGDTNVANLFIDQAAGVHGFMAERLPAYVEVELAVLEPSTAEKFKARAEIDLTRATNYLAKQIGRTHIFRQRIPIRPASTRFDAAFP